MTLSRIGSSTWQCGHQGAHTASTVGWFENASHETVPPCRPGAEKSGTGSPRASGSERAGPATTTAARSDGPAPGSPLPSRKATTPIATALATATTPSIRPNRFRRSRRRRAAAFASARSSRRSRLVRSAVFTIMVLRHSEKVVELHRPHRSSGQVNPREDDRDVAGDVPPGHPVPRAAAAEAPAVDRQTTRLRLQESGDEHGGEYGSGDAREPNEQAQDEEDPDTDLEPREERRHDPDHGVGQDPVGVDREDRLLPVERLAEAGPQQQDGGHGADGEPPGDEERSRAHCPLSWAWERPATGVERPASAGPSVARRAARARGAKCQIRFGATRRRWHSGSPRRSAPPQDRSRPQRTGRPEGRGRPGRNDPPRRASRDRRRTPPSASRRRRPRSPKQGSPCPSRRQGGRYRPPCSPTPPYRRSPAGRPRS